MNFSVSFVIPALNEASTISAAIESIHSAMGTQSPSYEIIVVDDDSADATAEIARRQQAQVVQVHKRNIAAVRNAGAGQARGKFLIFIDADTQVSPPLVQEALVALGRGAIWGTALATVAERCPLWARLGLTAYNHYYVRWRRCGYGFFFFVERHAFEQIGGFPEQTREGEDMALSKLLVAKHGAPAVLRARVATSARKIHQFGLAYHLKMLWLTLRYGDEAYSRPEIRDYRDGSLRLK
jgi:glycosyltransferase involved in cell wall biosynthesis